MKLDVEMSAAAHDAFAEICGGQRVPGWSTARRQERLTVFNLGPGFQG
jgi:hypothetical protein